MLLWRTTLEIKITTTKRKRKWKYWNIQSGFRMSFLRLFLLLFISLAFVVGLVAFLFPIPIHCAQSMGLVFIIALQGTNNAYRLQLFASHQSVNQSDRSLRKGHGWVTTADAFKAETGFGVTFSLSQCINITWFVWRPFDFEWLRARVANMLILCIKTGSAARVSRAMKIVCQQS